MPKNEAATIMFPKYGYSYDVRGGPAIDQLLAAWKDPKATVTFTLLGWEDDSQITSDLEVKINNMKPIDADRTLFAIGGEVIHEDGRDERISIHSYNGERAATSQ
jgi:hypothetical protein